jgi:hypothetical protein
MQRCKPLIQTISRHWTRSWISSTHLPSSQAITLKFILMSSSLLFIGHRSVRIARGLHTKILYAFVQSTEEDRLFCCWSFAALRIFACPDVGNHSLGEDKTKKKKKSDISETTLGKITPWNTLSWAALDWPCRAFKIIEYLQFEINVPVQMSNNSYCFSAWLTRVTLYIEKAFDYRGWGLVQYDWVYHSLVSTPNLEKPSASSCTGTPHRGVESRPRSFNGLSK